MPLFNVIPVLFSTVILYSCTNCNSQQTVDNANQTPGAAIIFSANNLSTSSNILENRFLLPDGFTRLSLANASFGSYLRQTSLKPPGTAVHYYNGKEKTKQVHAAVLNVSVGKKDLQQCADAIMRLRAEYFYSTKQYNQISFNLTNGFSVPFSKWLDGYKVSMQGNTCSWVKNQQSLSGRALFDNYLEFIYSYAGTLSLDKMLVQKNISEIEPGDVFVHGGSPGHAVIVMDVAKNDAGNIIFMLAQSYMPAQDIHILINEQEPGISPWYTLPKTTTLNTPEWNFNTAELKTWP